MTSRSADLIGTRAVGRDNHFNLIRMLAAVGVLISHAYPISLGDGATEPLQPWLNGTSLGTVCVYIFFAISGFFITKSFDRSPSRYRFIRARVLRVYPALLVVLVVTVCVGTIVTTAQSSVYWRESVIYIVRNLSLYNLQYALPGVFETNPFGPAINGSLWTLVHEIACYIGVFVAGIAGVLRYRRIMVVLLLAVVVAQFVLPVLPIPEKLLSLAKLALPFAVGVAFYLWRDVIQLRGLIGVILLIFAVIAYPTPLFTVIFVLALSYWVFLLGLMRMPALLAYNRLGDYSYGIYIYAFPVQQCVAYSGVTNPLMNILIALPVTLICAVLSWHIVEKPALSLVKRPALEQKAL